MRKELGVKTKKTKLVRHQLRLTGFPKSVDALMDDLRKIRSEASKTTPDRVMVGFNEYTPFVREDSSLVVQWDEQLPDDEEDQEDTERRESQDDVN